MLEQQLVLQLLGFNLDPLRHRARVLHIGADVPQGSDFTCQLCRRGYEGDGRTCTANEGAIQELEGVYWSQPEGLACDPGVDVEWPKEGPGEGEGEGEEEGRGRRLWWGHLEEPWCEA